MWLGLLVARLQLDDNGKFSCILPNTGGKLVTGKGAKAQTKHSELVARSWQSQGYSFTVTVDDSPYLYTNPRWHIYIDYHSERKKLQQRAFVIEEVEILLSFVLVRHGYVQHGGSKLSGSHCAQYDRYQIPGNGNLSDAIAFGCGGSPLVGSRGDALFLKKVGDSEKAEQDLDDSGSESSEDIDEENPELSDFRVKREKVSENE